MENLYIVGKWISPNCWEFGGVFNTLEKAIQACRDKTYFIGPAVLNEVTPSESVEWDGCFYPGCK